MYEFVATDLKNRLGDVADEARAGSIVITRSGRPDLVLLTARAFALLQKASDLVWGTTGQAGRAGEEAPGSVATPKIPSGSSIVLCRI